MEWPTRIKRNVVTLFLLSMLMPLSGILPEARANSSSPFEFSLGLSYNRKKYSGESYTWTRTWGLSIGLHLTPLTEVEFSLQDSVERNHVVNYEDTTFHDRIYSLSLIQNLLSRTFPVQPYFKVGIGQLNRDADGTYAGGSRPATQNDSILAVLGAGLRLYLTPRFAIRGEATSYLTGGSIGTVKDNIASTLGVSYFF